MAGLALLLAGGCQHGPQASTAAGVEATSGDANAAAETGAGGPDGVLLKPEEVGKAGIETVAAVAARHAPEAVGYGIVIAQDAIAQAAADLAAAAAAERQSSAAVARARGLADTRITTSYVGRNAILPLFTQLTISAGFVVGGSFLIESIFVYQGIGYVLGASIAQRDYPVMMGVFLVIAVSVICTNFLADFIYGRLDPRIRLGGGGD